MFLLFTYRGDARGQVVIPRVACQLGVNLSLSCSQLLPARGIKHPLLDVNLSSDRAKRQGEVGRGLFSKL